MILFLEKICEVIRSLYICCTMTLLSTDHFHSSKFFLQTWNAFVWRSAGGEGGGAGNERTAVKWCRLQKLPRLIILIPSLNPDCSCRMCFPWENCSHICSHICSWETSIRPSTKEFKCIKLWLKPEIECPEPNRFSFCRLQTICKAIAISRQRASILNWKITMP